MRQNKIKDSIPQKILFKELMKIFPTHNLRYNYRVKTKRRNSDKEFNNFRYIDVADLTTYTGYEYDGKKWHRRPDKKRDDELIRAGWRVVHINKYNIQEILDSLEHKV